MFPRGDFGEYEEKANQLNTFPKKSKSKYEIDTSHSDH